ncbi:hypothetical protein H9Q73_000487 [Fusarium xylarioides]|nr:hypothetical protein H9Q73_000487 [Fusarium xylarioides]
MAGLQPDIYAAISITWVAAFLALSLRLKARRMTKMNLWFDDYFAMIALVGLARALLGINERVLTIHHSFLYQATVPSRYTGRIATNSANPSSRSQTQSRRTEFKTDRDFYSGSANFSTLRPLHSANSVFSAFTGAFFNSPRFDMPLLSYLWPSAYG